MASPRPAAAGCLFCRIARGEEPAAMVLEGPEVVVFLDHRPLFPGHCLVVPRRHVDTLGDLPPAQLGKPRVLSNVLSHRFPHALLGRLRSVSQERQNVRQPGRD